MLVSVVEETGLNLALSETPKTGFVVMRLTGNTCANKIVLEQTSPIVVFQLIIYLFTFDNFTLNSIFGPEAFIKKKHALQYQLHSHCSTILYLFILISKFNKYKYKMVNNGEFCNTLDLH